MVELNLKSMEISFTSIENPVKLTTYPDIHYQSNLMNIPLNQYSTINSDSTTILMSVKSQTIPRNDQWPATTPKLGIISELHPKSQMTNIPPSNLHGLLLVNHQTPRYSWASAATAAQRTWTAATASASAGRSSDTRTENGGFMALAWADVGWWWIYINPGLLYNICIYIYIHIISRKWW